MKNLSKYLFEDEASDLLEDIELNEDESSSDTTMTDEDLKVESLKIATNIAKLMADVTVDDVISIAGKVSDFIRNHNIGSEEKTEETKDVESKDEEKEVPEDLDFEIPEVEKK